MNKVYFPGLNGIRAIAALIVLIFHIDLVLPSFGLKEIGYHKNNMAGYGVTMFFVLSGFLITSLLLTEKSHFQNITVKNFYVRRILRIWPLYYFAFFLGLFLIVSQLTNYSSKFAPLLYFAFMPNVAFALKHTVTAITPLWSVGVEEQFYAFWPWLIKYSSNFIKVFLIVILIYLIVKLIGRLYLPKEYYDLIYISSFDCMAIGGIGAVWVHKKNRYILQFAYNKLVQFVCWIILVISCVYKPIHVVSFLDQEINACVYLILIINVATNPRTLITLENAFFDFIGKISYGIYVYHFIIISFLAHFMYGKVANNFYGYLFVFVLIITCTLFIAFLSFKYFEKWFLDRKANYSIVRSQYAKSE